MYDGYAMKYGAYDYLALRTFSKRGTCVGVGHRIGCGKESDIILVQDEAGHECVLKLQRLGRCSFRSVMRNRDYKGNGRTRHGESWFYLSRLASQKEYAFMKVLYDEGFPVPRPIDQNRHALVMELVPGVLLNSINDLQGHADKVYRRCLELMIKLAEQGLIHGDFNEFNLMITEDLRVVMLDFPQMISTNHKNANELFDRDVQNLANFFQRRFQVSTLWYPSLEKDVVRKGNLDKQVYASGHYTQRDEQDLKQLMEAEFAKQQQQQYHKNESGDGERSESESGSNDEDRDSHEADAEGEIDHADCDVVAIPREPDAEEDEGSRPSSASESSEDDRDSLDEAVAAARRQRTNTQGANPNFLPDGGIDKEHIKNQVRKSLRRRDNHEFYSRLHHNTQKGRHKQKIDRELKDAKKEGFW